MKKNETECLLCNGKATLKHNEYPGYQEPFKYKIYHCPDCNTAFSLPRNDNSEIYENIYKNGDKVPGYSRYWRHARIIKNLADPLDYLAHSHEDYWSIKEALSMYVNDKTTTKILEIGSGLGYLTYSLIKAGYNVTGMDVSQTAVDQATRSFGNHFITRDLFEYAKNTPELYDIIILSEVIEHVPSPTDFIESIIRLLKPGARAIITTPNKSFFPSEVIWASDLPPVHCWWLSEESMSYIAKKFNANVGFINFGEYYKMNFHVMGIRSLLENRLPNPYFNSRGELIKYAKSTSALKFNIQLLFFKISWLNTLSRRFKKYGKLIYGKLRVILGSKVIVCKERGHIMCSIMQKPLNKIR